MMMRVKRERLIENLKKGIVQVTFTKADGTIREMNASLASKYITEELKPKGNDTRIPDPDLIHVIDTDINQWRSFRLSTVRRIQWEAE